MTQANREDAKAIGVIGAASSAVAGLASYGIYKGVKIAQGNKDSAK